MSDIADPRELEFLLYDCLDAEALCARPRFAEHGRETFDQALDTARRIATDLFAPHNRTADEREPWLENGQVRCVPEVKAALDAFAAAGFLAAHHDAERGGLQLPWVVVQACFAWFLGANIATTAYPFLTIAAANLLEAFADEDQKRRYMLPMLDGRFFGTMALSEPQAGSSLADIRTTAVAAGDGSYRLKGTKQWISGGFHELSDNIVHLVLARIEGAPPGVKGLSLFAVPRYLVAADGSLGAHNDVALVSLLHKLGYRGTTSTILSFGENDACVAELVGAPNQGLACMFHMMNEARIGVGSGAAMLGIAGYRYALDYARTRLQGRPLDARDPGQLPVPIIRHPDVKRMLLAQKAYAEGALALCLYAARLVDDQRTAPDPQARADAGLLLDVLTPICKAWPSEYALRANDLAIQVLGGYGYTRDYPVEQHWRDNRLNPIHEGTNGIQALDLLGRKVPMGGGAGFELLMARLRETVAEAEQTDGLESCGGLLHAAVEDMEAVTETLLLELDDGPDVRVLGNATLYLEALGHTVVAWCWLWQAIAAARGLSQDADDARAAFLQGKLQACRYFLHRELPKVHWRCRVLAAFDTIPAQTEEDWF